MDPAHGSEIHHHLARAIMHLNSLAGFLPFFEPAVDWEDAHMAPSRTHEPTPYTLRYGRPSTSRLHPHLHSPYPTLATHGDLPRQMVPNPVPHFRPISSTMSPRTFEPDTGTASTPAFLPIHHTSVSNEDQLTPQGRTMDERPNKRPRTEGPHETGLVILPPQPKPPSISSRPMDTPMPKTNTTTPATLSMEHPPPTLPSIRTPADSAATDSSDHEDGPHPGIPDTLPNPARAVSIVLARSRQRREEREALANLATHTHPAIRSASPPNTAPNLGPEILISTKTRGTVPPDVPGEGMPIPFKPWTDAEDRELAAYKTDTKSRPSWKTIGARLNRNPEVCRLRWAAIKTTIQPPRPEPEAEDPE